MTDDKAWHDWRRGGIGASDIGGILGSNPRWSSPWKVWAAKCGLTQPTESTERQQDGHDFEPVIAVKFHRRTGLYVAGEQTMCTASTAEPWMRCTADGFVFETPRHESYEGSFLTALGGFEAKTDGRFGWPDGVPEQYEAQCQWSMAVTGMERWWIAVLFAGFRFEVFEVKRSESDIRFMTERARAFWFDHVVTGNPPPTDGSQATLDALAEVYPDPLPDSSVELGDEARGAFTRWRAAKDGIREWERIAKEAQAELQATLGDAEQGAINGVPVVSWRQQTRAAHQVAESTSRVLRPIKPPKEKP